MNTNGASLRSFSLALASAAVLFAGIARAQSVPTCTSDSDCVRGFTCQPTPCPPSAPPCAQGTTCTPEPVCVPQLQPKQCSFAPCTSTSDCGTGMTCYTATDTTCGTTAAPAPGASSGGAMGTSGCVTTTRRLCAPLYLLPCTSDASCGAGFTCKLSQTCSGSSGGGGEVCDTGTTGHCKAPEIACTSDAACPSDWTCGTVTIPGTRTCTAGGVAIGDGSVDPPPQQPVCTTTPSVTKQLCVPPYYEQVAALEGQDSFNTGNQKGLPARGQSTGGASSGDSGGCQIALGGARSEGVALLGLVGILGLARRRRARA